MVGYLLEKIDIKLYCSERKTWCHNVMLMLQTKYSDRVIFFARPIS